MALLTAFLTAYYTGRQLCMVLFGAPRSSGAAEASDSPWVMTLPLVVLALLSVIGWLPGNPLAEHSLLATYVLPVVELAAVRLRIHCLNWEGKGSALQAEVLDGPAGTG